ncbi:hypothetical protein [Actinomarinicola tropica]|uniref:Aromatic ring-opening dioxygenase LigA n=1 Tax=Actinomarinicola tropica TaxID=2789776 RepID=A0A5Q2RD56_9ACTN|nr:hypothetical protein [Actinomarinicola tropica]QGG93644.1 hypothetical protein GH723_00135 [Actinomarinicola tropica]
MKRKTLDLAFSIGGLGIAVLLLIFGIVLQGEANFADDYVAEQFSEQQIYFTPAEELSEEEAQAECLVEYGSGSEEERLLDSGKEAECYANEYIGLHLRQSTGGLSYAQLGEPQSELRAQIEAAEADGDDTADLEEELAAISQQRDTAFRGETLRGILLTAYGFSEIGAKASLAATVAFVGAALMLLLSIAGFVHWARTPETATVD